MPLARRFRGKRLTRAVIVGCLLLAGLFPGVARSTMVVPECAGEKATHVLVAPGTADEYDFGPGVDVQDHPDQLFLGTEGRDVMVALVPTEQGGFVSDPNDLDEDGNPIRGTATNGAGDVMCGTDGVDLFYASKGGGDTIIARGGDDFIYAGGGSDVIRAGSGSDRIWGFRVQADQTQVIRGGGGQDHIYVGRGGGTVVVHGGSSPADVAGGGDHVHPCPLDSDGGDIEAHGIEYFGREDAFTDAPADPCAYTARSLGVS